MLRTQRFAKTMSLRLFRAIKFPEAAKFFAASTFLNPVRGSIQKYKARLVVQSFMEVKGIDYDETFAPTARATSIRLLLSLAGI